MKKTLLTLALVLAAIAASAQNDWHYSVNDDGTATVTNYKHKHLHDGVEVEANCHCYSGDAVIPSTLGGHTVTAIGKQCFYYCNITSVTIPNTVKLIGEEAFYVCDYLKELTIPASVDSIAPSGVHFISNLKILTIEDSPNVLKVANGGGMANSTMFNYKPVTTVYIGRDLLGDPCTSGHERLFSECESLETVTMGEEVTEVPAVSFVSCPALKKVTLGSNITRIGDKAFDSCSELVEINLPEGLTYIGKSAFSYCKALLSPKFPETLRFIDEGAYQRCEAITEITIPAAIDSIPSSPFIGCPIEKLVIADSRKLLRLHTSVDFRGLGALKTLYIGRNFNYPVTPSIGRTLFWGTENLESITFGNYVTDIAESTFRNCSKLKKVTFGPNMTYISDCAFSQCESLASADLPDALNYIGKCAFSYCKALPSPKFPKTLTFIDEGAYERCEAITEITIPASVDSIASSPFYGCPIEKLVIADSRNLLKLHTSVGFRDLGSLKTLYIGRNYSYTIKPSIGYALFQNSNEMESVTFGKYITEILESTFNNCQKLREVTFGSNITNIGKHAFYNCGSLTSVSLPDGLTEIKENTFGYCEELSSLKLPANLKTIGDWAFHKVAIDVLRLPATVEYLGYSSFSYTPNLKTIYSENPTPPTCDGVVFDGSEGWKDKTVYVPAASVDAYKDAEPWKNFVTIQAIAEAKVKLSKTKAVIEKGKTLTLKAKVYPTTEDQTVTWKSSDKKVATVTSAGKVKGVGAGTATITCTSKATGAKATCKVTVGYVKLSKTEVSIEKGEIVTLKSKVYPSTVKDQSVTWESSDPTIVKVASSGKIKGMKVGKATITCTSNATGLKATCEVTVGYVKLSKTEVTIEKGKTLTLKAKVYPTSEDQTVTWESSDPTIVKVASTGKIKGLKVGKAVITCTSNATGQKATCKVTVVKAAAAPSLDGTDEDVTGIEEKSALAEEFDVYDLNGRRVLNKVTSLDGLSDGVYIVNGKKVVIK